MSHFTHARRACQCLALTVCILCVAASHAIAQADIAIVAIKLPPNKVEIGLPVQVTLAIKNNGPQQSQTFNCQFQIINTANGSTVFTGTIAGRVMQVNEQADFTSTQSWQPNALGNYQLQVTIEAQNDPTPSNNQAQQPIQIVPISIQRAVNILKASVITPDPRRDLIEAYHVHPPARQTDSLLKQGDTISPFDDEFTIILSEPTYLFFVDDFPNELFTHPCRIVTISGITGAIQNRASQAWPVINNEAVSWGPGCGPNFDRVHGNAKACTPKINPYNAVATSNTVDWALATGGVVRNDVEESVVDQDICRWKERINGTPSGPHVTGANIDVQRGQNNRGLTKKEFCDLIESYKGKACDKFFWKHIGHGSEKGLLFWDDNHKREVILSYEEIAKKFAEAGIREVCIEITACHSGAIIAALAKEKIKGVVITSSSKPRTTPYEPDGSGTAWEKALDSCSKDPAANLNRDPQGHIDLCELYAWVKVKGSAKVNGPDPQIMKLGDTVRFVNAKLSNVSRKPETWGGSYIQQICVNLKVKQGNKEKDSAYYSYTLYIENTTDKEVTSDKTYNIVVTCDAPGGKKTKVTLVEGYKPKIGPKEKICLTNVPPDCKNPKHSFEEIKKKKKIAMKDDDLPSTLSAVDDTLRSMGIISEYGVHDPGQFFFYRYILTDTNNAANYTTSISAPPIWTAYVMPGNFFVPVNDSADIFFGATMPDTATQGALIQTTIINKTVGDTTLYQLNVLLADTTTGTITSPFTADYRWIVASGRLAPTGTSRIDNSFIDVADSFAIASSSATAFSLRNTIISADSGKQLRVDLGGAKNELTDVMIRGSQNGVTVTPTDLTVNNLVIAGSAATGLTLNGAPTQARTMNYISSIGSRANGMAFNNTGTNALQLYGAMVDLAGEKDLVLTTNSKVDCLDCIYADSNVTVDNTSMLRRFATLSVAVNDTNGNPLGNVAVTVTNASGTEVFKGSTDNLGFIPSQRLLVSERTGSTYTNYAPYRVTVKSSSEQMDTTYAPVAYKQFVFWMSPGASSVTVPGQAVAGYDLSPTPALKEDGLMIRARDGAEAIAAVEIINVLGEHIAAERFEAARAVHLSLDGFTSGTYFARITDRSGMQRTLPFVVR